MLGKYRAALQPINKFQWTYPHIFWPLLTFLLPTVPLATIHEYTSITSDLTNHVFYKEHCLHDRYFPAIDILNHHSISDTMVTEMKTSLQMRHELTISFLKDLVEPFQKRSSITQRQKLVHEISFTLQVLYFRQDICATDTRTQKMFC